MTPDRNSVITIGVLLPDLLSTYGDDGNTTVLSKRLRDRGYATEIKRICLHDPMPTCDIYTLGGGEDVAQIIAAEYLRSQSTLLTALDDGTPLLAICAGMQMLGEWFQIGDGSRVEGVGVLDARTVPQSQRAISELVTEPLLPGLSAPLTGFENHLGATILGPDASPLGAVRHGTGNGAPASPLDGPDGSDAAKDNAKNAGGRFDGISQNGIIATYMHGPCLARNPELADYLIAKILGVALTDLGSLDIPVVDLLRRERLHAAMTNPTRHDRH